MAHVVFISYSHHDKLAADKVCAALEAAAFQCWIAPRDVMPGLDYGEQLIDAIEGSRAMVLVFSANANASRPVRNEVERAFHKGVVVIPIRIENIKPSRSLEFFISSQHWLDAPLPNIEQAFPRLIEALIRINSHETQLKPSDSRDLGSNSGPNQALFPEFLLTHQQKFTTRDLVKIFLNRNNKKISRKRIFIMAGVIGASFFVETRDGSQYPSPLIQDNVNMRRGQKRALVVGNAAYKIAMQLRTPTADAQAVASALQHAGFFVSLYMDISNSEFLQAIQEFVDSSDESSIALFYYAGHGVSYENQNWMLGVDSDFKSTEDIVREAVSLNIILEKFKKMKIRILIVDACRDNPFRIMSRNLRSFFVVSELPPGLAAVEKHLLESAILVYSAEPGGVALDGVLDGDNSPFATAFLHHMLSPGIEIRVMFSKVRKEVFDITDHKQLPMVEDGLFEEFFLTSR